MKLAVKAIKLFESFANEGLRGKITQKFFYGLLKLIKPRAKLVDSDLKLIYPESSEKWRKDIRNKVYKNLSWTLTETLILQHDNSKVFEWVKSVKGIEYFNDAIKANKGAIIFTGHYGNWELAGSFVAQRAKLQGHELNVLYQEMHDKDISNYIRETREKGGMKMINKKTSALKLSHMLKSGELIAMLNDVSGTSEMIVPFLGHDATNMPGPAVIAMLSGSPVIPFCIHRLAPFEHEAEFFAPLELPKKDKNISSEERIKLILLEMNNALGKFIIERPEEWFWLHNRWKVRKKNVIK